MSEASHLTLYSALAILGIVTGVVGGMLGVGGSLIMIPALTEIFGPDQHLYQAAAMIVNFFVAAPAVFQHYRQKAIDLGAIRRFIPLAAVSVLAGVAVSELPFFTGPQEPYLRAAFGVFLLLVSGYELLRLLRSQTKQLTVVSNSTAAPTTSTWSAAALVAVPAGFIGGLLGVGGGVLAVPLQRRFLHIPIRIAIANSASIVLATSFIGASGKNIEYLQDHPGSMRPLLIAAVLIPTASLGSILGSRWTHRLPIRAIKAAFCIMLCMAALRFTYGALTSIDDP